MGKNEKQELISNIARMKELGWKGSDNPTIQEIADDMPESVSISKHNRYWSVYVSYPRLYREDYGCYQAAHSTGCNRKSLLQAISEIWISYKEDLLRGEEPVKNPESFKEKVREVLEYHGRMRKAPEDDEDELERDLGDEGILEQINLIHEASAKDSK